MTLTRSTWNSFIIKGDKMAFGDFYSPEMGKKARIAETIEFNTFLDICKQNVHMMRAL